MLLFYAQLFLCYSSSTPKSQSPVICEKERKKHEEVAGRISRLQPPPSAKYMGTASRGERADVLSVSNHRLGKNQQHNQSMMIL